MGEKEPQADIPTTSRRHPTAIWFFFWGEFAERASFYGMRAILPLYLTSVLGYSDADGGERYYWFKMAAYFLPLLGGIVADRWLGRYWTIVGFSVPYVLGHFVLGIESRFWCMVALFALLAPGTGVIKPNISSLLGETYDQQRPGQDSLRVSGFQYFYFAINVGALISMFVVPIIRTKYDYATAFQFPAWLMVGALAIFALGKPYYATETGKRDRTPAQWQEQNATLGLFGVMVSLLAWYLAYRFRDDLVQFVFARYAFGIPPWA
jgi:dipeptide/tripeptide permease